MTVARLAIFAFCLAVTTGLVMDSKDSSPPLQAAGTSGDRASHSPASPPSIVFPSTPELGEKSIRFDNPSTPPTPAQVDTPSEGRVVDPPTPIDDFDVNSESPDYAPTTKRSRQLSPKIHSRSTTKRKLLMQDEGSTSGKSAATHVGAPPTEANPPVQPFVQGEPPVHDENSTTGQSSATRPAARSSKRQAKPPLQPPNQGKSPDPPRSSSDSDAISGTNSESDCGELGSESSESSDSGEDSSDESGDDSDKDDEDDLLYPGANLTVAEAVVDVMDLYVNHHWSKACLKDTLKTMDRLLPELHQLPTTTHQLFKFVEDFSFVPPAEKYFYCAETNCFKLKAQADQKCSSCESESTGKCFHFPLDEQIKYLFEQRHLAEAIDSFKSRQNKNSEEICYICDGEEYVKIKSKLTGQYDLVLQWNIDGVSAAHSSSISMWYLLCIPCEVPPELRSSYGIVAAEWCDIKKPPMNMFLEPFDKWLIKIFQSGGVEWTHPVTGDQFKGVVVAPLLVADAPATAEALIAQYFSALYGCNTCEQKRAVVKIPAKRKTGETETILKTARRFVFQETPAPLRYGQRMDKRGVQAEEKEEPVKGVLGRAVVSKIPFFGRGRGKAAEYMHCVLLGVVKYFTLLWFETPGPWCIKKDFNRINRFLKSIRVPHYVNRPTTAGLKTKFWKASEWRSWLLYYSLPALEGILPDKFLQHWMLLVQAIYILLSENITDSDLGNAEIMLRMFVRDVKELYGESYYSYNVHQLLHLCLSTKRWGPLRDTSAFPFENYNGILGSLIIGTKHKAQELVNQIKLVQGVIAMKNFVERSKTKVRQKFRSSSCRGRPISMVLNCEEQAALSEANIVNCVFHRRAVSNGVKFSSLVYDKKKRKVNSFVKLSLTDHLVGYAQILFFVKVAARDYAFLRIYDVDHVRTFFHEKTTASVNHIVPCKESTSLRVLPINQIFSVVLKVGSFFVIPPNSVECNL